MMLARHGDTFKLIRDLGDGSMVAVRACKNRQAAVDWLDGYLAGRASVQIHSPATAMKKPAADVPPPAPKKAG